MFPQKIQKVDHQDRQANRDRLPVIQPVYRPIPLTATYGPKTLKPSELGSLFRPAKIIIAGHSFIPHLKDYMDDYFGPRHNMGLSYNSASVYFRGRGGHLASDLLSSGVMFVSVGQVIPRNYPEDPWWQRHHPLHPEFNKRVVIVNTYLKHVLDPVCHENTLYWKHRGFWCPLVAVLEEGDGVHPNNYGNQIMYRSIRGSLVHALKRIQDKLRI